MPTFEYKIVVSEKGIQILDDAGKAVKAVETATAKAKEEIKRNVGSLANALKGISDAASVETSSVLKQTEERLEAAKKKTKEKHKQIEDLWRKHEAEKKSIQATANLRFNADSQANIANDNALNRRRVAQSLRDERARLKAEYRERKRIWSEAEREFNAEQRRARQAAYSASGLDNLTAGMAGYARADYNARLRAEMAARNVTGLGARAAAFAGGVGRNALAIGGAVAGYRTASAIADGAQDIFKFNSELEQMRLGIAEINSISGNFVDKFGNALPLAEQFKLSMIEAKSATAEILADSVRLGLPVQALKEGYTVIAGMAKAAGFNQRQVLDLTEAVATVSQRIGIDQSQVTRTIDNIISGQRVQATTLGVILGLNQKDVQAAREKGELVEYLLGRLQSVTALLPKNLETWEGIKAAIASASREFAVGIGGDAFNTAKAAATGFLDVIKEINANKELVTTVKIMLDDATGLGLGGIKLIFGALTKPIAGAANIAGAYLPEGITPGSRAKAEVETKRQQLAQGTNKLLRMREGTSFSPTEFSELAQSLPDLAASVGAEGDSKFIANLIDELKGRVTGGFSASNTSGAAKSIAEMKKRGASSTIAAARGARTAGAAAKNAKAVADATNVLKAARLKALEEEAEGYNLALPATPDQVTEFETTKQAWLKAERDKIDAEFATGEVRADRIGATAAKAKRGRSVSTRAINDARKRIPESARALQEASAKAAASANEGTVKALEAQLELTQQENGSLGDQLQLLAKIHELQRANLNIKIAEAKETERLATESVQARESSLTAGPPEPSDVIKLNTALREQVEAQERIRQLQAEGVELTYEQSSAVKKMANDWGRTGELIDEVVNGIASGNGSFKGSFKRFAQAQFADNLSNSIKGGLGALFGPGGGSGGAQSMGGLGALFGGGAPSPSVTSGGQASTSSTTGNTAGGAPGSASASGMMGGLGAKQIFELGTQAAGIGFMASDLAKSMSRKRNQPGTTRGDLRLKSAGMGAKIGAGTGALAASAIGMAGGAAAGAAAGSAVPIIGTAIGAALGAIFGSLFAPKPKTTETLVQRALDKSIAGLEGLDRDDFKKAFINTRDPSLPSDYADIGAGDGAGLLFGASARDGFGRGGFDPGMIRRGVLSYASSAGYASEDARKLYRGALRSYGGETMDEAIKKLNMRVVMSGGRGSGKAGSRYGIDSKQFRGALGDVIASYNDLPAAIDAAALAQRAFTEDGKLQLEALKRSIEGVQDTITGGITDAFNSLLTSQSPSNAARAMADKFSEALSSRVSERLLERKDIGGQLTEAATLSEAAAEKFALGDLAGGNALLKQARSLARAGQATFLRVATPIAAATRVGGYGFGSAYGGVENQTGFGMPSFDTNSMKRVPGPIGMPMAATVHGGEVVYNPQYHDDLLREIRMLRASIGGQQNISVDVRPVLEVDGRAFDYAIRNNKARNRVGVSMPNTSLGVSQ